MFLPALEPGTASELLKKKHAQIFELLNELGTAVAHRRMAFADGKDGKPESEMVSVALCEIIEASLAVDVVIAMEHAKVEPSAGLLSPAKLEHLLPSPVLMWNEVLLVIRRYEENRAAAYASHHADAG